jgi:hypothetical protein
MPPPGAPRARKLQRAANSITHTALKTRIPFSLLQKLDAVRSWLALQASAGGGVRGGRALVLSGPAGAGKSAAARVLAAAAGFALVEWAPPVPTLWEEHRHHGGGEYVSKVRTCARV